jgi:hypothetical protein
LLGCRPLGGWVGLVEFGARHAGIIARGSTQLYEKAVLIGQISRDLYGGASHSRNRH